MIFERVWAAALLGSAIVVSAFVNTRDESLPSFTSKIIPGAYIIELEEVADADGFLGQLRREGGVKKVSTRQRLDSDVFRGVSFQVESANFWPVWLVHQPPVIAEIKSQSEVRRRAEEYVNYAPHVLTQVDQLHAKGYKGQGLTIAVLDTGIDYTHPALGGCFGKPECLVTHGTDLIGDDWNGSSAPVPDDDPGDNCQGHGTHVAGIIAAQPGFDGPIGAAPGVKLGAYRVLSCLGYSSTDLMIAGLLEAYKDKNDIITGSIGYPSGWAGDAFSVAAARIVDKGVPVTFSAGNEGGANYGLFSSASPSSGDGVMAISSFDDANTPSFFTNWGPTFEMDLKPQFGAPGRYILSTYPVALGSYAVLSGTSMSCPLVAAIVALVSEVGAALSSTVSRSAVRSTSGGISGLAPVIQQGAGMIQAFAAAYVNSQFSVSNLVLNDTEFFVSKTSFKIKNDGNMPTTYSLYNTPALTAITFEDSIYRTSSPGLFDNYATLTFDPPTFTLKRGDSAKICVTVKQPVGLDAANLPVYSGWISVNASNANGPFTISLPYMGAAGALRSHTVMVTDRMWLTQSADYYSNYLPENFTFQLPAPAAHPTWAVPVLPASDTISEVGSYPSQFLYPVFGVSSLSIEPIPSGPASNQTGVVPLKATDNGFGLLTIGNVARYPLKHIAPVGGFANWNGLLASGDWAPPGMYKLSVSALKLFGNKKKKEDYDIFISGVFELRYV